jgi:hypothetical protein
MKSLRSIPVVLTAGLGVFLVFPVAMASYAASHSVSVALPSFHSQVEGQNVTLTPISEKKAQAIHAFKLTQI